MDLLSSIEQSDLARALKASFYAYPLVNALHILAIGAVATLAGLIDLRILGAIGEAALPRPATLRRLALAAFAVALVTGVFLFSVRAGDYAANTAFRLKLMLIVLAGCNFLAFMLLTRGGDAATSAPARALAALSLLLWVGVVLAGRFIAFV